MTELPQELIATAVAVEDGMVRLTLSDGSLHAFPVHYYPRLSHASRAELSEACLRVGGRALRWETLDEDIWVADAVCQRYPKQPTAAVAESPQPYGS